MHDDITSSKFTTKPCLYEIPWKPLQVHVVFEWDSFQFRSFENTLMGLSQDYTSKARLGGEISLSDVNMHKVIWDFS